MAPTEGRVARPDGGGAAAVVPPSLCAGQIWQLVNTVLGLLLLVWHAPLGVHSAKHRHWTPEWTARFTVFQVLRQLVVFVKPNTFHTFLIPMK